MTAKPQRDPASEAGLRPFEDRLSALPVRQGRLERVLRGVFRAWCWPVAWHLHVEGMGSLPQRPGRAAGAGCVVTAAPHRAWVEPFLLFLAWPADAARLVWLADRRTVTASRWRRWLLPRLGIIPISGKVSGPKGYAAMAGKVLDAGAALAVFPEVGPPSPPGRTRAVSAGFAYMAIAAGAPVVPVVIGGTHRIVRGSSFSVGTLSSLEVGSAPSDPFTLASRERAQALARRYEAVVNAELPVRNAWAAARAPRRDRWRWLGSLFG